VKINKINKEFDVKNSRKNAFIRDRLQLIIQKDLRNYIDISGVLITIINTILSNQGHTLKVYLNVIPDNQKENIVDVLNSNKSIIRKILGNALANDLKHIPDLEFFLDTSFERIQKIENLLKNID
jgi:ribosome-binding factor A